ncbi:Phosphocarrier protein HPr [Sinobacterium norvegicum]|uniref:Phosphocarrier protein HPr n=1 Tax=Sinobacterium norvegicum TaxID=1641715 RepID=A0ABM9AJB3_9GAMM|nr:HPr family phosphocarrier protein [Sinobacterium norvegicum]CAH0993328.1 Phosphocarrier protein HPr [Sinobacterium norvegicum]
MVEQQIEIINKLGVHARAAAKLVTVASAFASQIAIIRDEKSVDSKSIMSVMMLAASKGSWITIRCEGSDETAAMEAVCQLINNRFDEDE